MNKLDSAFIGLFVIVGLAVLTLALVMLGAGRFSGDWETYVLYFRSNTNGLSVGAPVVLQGVKIGVVKEVRVAYDSRGREFFVPVYIAIDQEQVVWPGELEGMTNGDEIYKGALEAGVRARLSTESLLTGLQQIEIGFFPDSDLVLYDRDTRYKELPTIESELEQLRAKLVDLPLDHIAERAIVALEGIDRLLASPELPAILANLDRATREIALAVEETRLRTGTTLDRIDTALDGVNQLTQTLQATASEPLANLGRAAGEIADLAKTTDAELGQRSAQLERIGETARLALVSARDTSEEIASLVGERSPLRREALDTLRALSAAANALRGMADYLERHPESLLQGKR